MKHKARVIIKIKGGPGSGNWGHRGIPGKVGGSSPRGTGSVGITTLANTPSPTNGIRTDIVKSIRNKLPLQTKPLTKKLDIKKTRDYREAMNHPPSEWKKLGIKVPPKQKPSADVKLSHVLNWLGGREKVTNVMNEHKASAEELMTVLSDTLNEQVNHIPARELRTPNSNMWAYAMDWPTRDHNSLKQEFGDSWRDWLEPVSDWDK